MGGEDGGEVMEEVVEEEQVVVVVEEEGEVEEEELRVSGGGGGGGAKGEWWWWRRWRWFVHVWSSGFGGERCCVKLHVPCQAKPAVPGQRCGACGARAVLGAVPVRRGA